MAGSDIFFVISLITFILLVVSGILAYINFPKWTLKIFWNIFTNTSLAIACNKVVLYIIFSIVLLFALISVIFIIMYRNDEGLRAGMLGQYSKFHFIPILCAIALYIIGEAYGYSNLSNIAPLVFGLIFSLIGLGSLIFIYKVTEISKYYARLAIKKGLYACLIALFVYNLCFTITYLGMRTLARATSWAKGCFIAFSLIIGIINLVLSFFFKDVMLSGMNVLIYLGMIINFFRIDKSVRNNYNGVAEGIIDIIFEVLSLGMICFLVIRYKTIMLN
jgi:hypothetical protein